MARQARVKTEFGTYHIIQQGGQCRDLFINDLDRDKFVSIIRKTQEKFGFTLHGFCLLSNNGYDLILELNGTDLSKVMKSINISYALYAKCDGKLFNDRYKSYPLDSPLSLYESKREIRNKQVSQNSQCYNMCFDNIETSSKDDILLGTCTDCITCSDSALEQLEKIAQIQGLSLTELTTDKDRRNELIKSFRKSSTLSLKSIGELFGGLSESSVSKIINS